MLKTKVIFERGSGDYQLLIPCPVKFISIFSFMVTENSKKSEPQVSISSPSSKIQVPQMFPNPNRRNFPQCSDQWIEKLAVIDAVTREYEKRIFESINQFRKETGWPPLEWKDELCIIARIQANLLRNDRNSKLMVGPFTLYSLLYPQLLIIHPFMFSGMCGFEFPYFMQILESFRRNPNEYFKSPSISSGGVGCCLDASGTQFIYIVQLCIISFEIIDWIPTKRFLNESISFRLHNLEKAFRFQKLSFICESPSGRTRSVLRYNCDSEKAIISFSELGHHKFRFDVIDDNMNGEFPFEIDIIHRPLPTLIKVASSYGS